MEILRRPLICRIRTIEEVRRLRLVALVKAEGSLVAINEKIGLTKRDSTLSQILNRALNSKTKTPKTMGSPMARKLETAYELETGLMDTDPALTAAWPFPNIDPDRFDNLEDWQKLEVQGAARTKLIELEQQSSSGKSTPSGSPDGRRKAA